MNPITRLLDWLDRGRRPRKRPRCPDCGRCMVWAPFAWKSGDAYGRNTGVHRLYVCSHYYCPRIVAFEEAYDRGWLTGGMR